MEFICLFIIRNNLLPLHFFRSFASWLISTHLLSYLKVEVVIKLKETWPGPETKGKRLFTKLCCCAKPALCLLLSPLRQRQACAWNSEMNSGLGMFSVWLMPSKIVLMYCFPSQKCKVKYGLNSGRLYKNNKPSVVNYISSHTRVNTYTAKGNEGWRSHPSF